MPWYKGIYRAELVTSSCLGRRETGTRAGGACASRLPLSISFEPAGSTAYGTEIPKFTAGLLLNLSGATLKNTQREVYLTSLLSVPQPTQTGSQD